MRWRDANAKKSGGYDEPAVPEESWIHAFTRFWVTALVIGAIVYGAVIAVGRSDGFRGGVRNRLETATGLTLELDRVRVTPALRLQLAGLRETGKEIPGLDIAEATLSLRFTALFAGDPWPLRSLEMQGATLRFSRDKDGAWSPFPEWAGPVEAWLSAVGHQEGTIPLTAWMRSSGTRFQLKNINLTWMENDETASIRVEGMSWRAVTVRPFDEDALWSSMSVQSAARQGETWIRDLAIEWLSLPDESIVLRANQALP